MLMCVCGYSKPTRHIAGYNLRKPNSYALPLRIAPIVTYELRERGGGVGEALTLNLHVFSQNLLEKNTENCICTELTARFLFWYVIDGSVSQCLSLRRKSYH